MAQCVLENEVQKEIQVKSAERVREHGEVLTARREVEAMLDLVKYESERIDSRFLEPACGTGNFLCAILERKLNAVAKRYKSKKADFEVQMLSALGSVYGIDLLEDNVNEAQERLFNIACEYYRKYLRVKPDEVFKRIVKFVLSKNILQGDSLNGIDKIVFTQWTLIRYWIRREEYSFKQINRKSVDNTLFAHLQNENGEDVYIPQAIKVYNNVFYRNLLEVAE